MKRSKAIRKHLNKRSVERIGATLSPGLQRELVERIQSGTAQHVQSTTHTRSLWKMEIGGQMMMVAYNKKFHCIVSVWPAKEEESGAGRHSM